MVLHQSLAGSLYREHRDTLPELPLCIVEGQPGTGKTELLGQLGSEWHEKAPMALIELRRADPRARLLHVVVTTADDIVRRNRMPKRLFPRLLLGLAATEGPLLGPMAHAARQLEEDLRNADIVISRVRDAVTTARRILGLLLPDYSPALAAEAGLGLIEPAVWSVRRRLPSWTWFAAATGSSTGTYGLVHLNRRAHDGDPARRAEVDRILLEAFLADLRSAFTRWSSSDRLDHNILLLLDDADLTRSDGETRLLFVDDLLAARAGGTGDPLVVVATSGVRNASASLRVPSRPAGPVTIQDLSHNVPAPDGRADATERWRVSLAAGHRGAYERSRAAGTDAALETLFPPSVADDMVARAVAGHPPDLEADLRVLAAICPDDPDGAAHAFTRVHAPARVPGPAAVTALTRYHHVARFVAATLWPGDPRPGDAPRLMHPFFRRAFLARLSHPAESSQWGWDLVFGRLAAMHHTAPDRVWHHHYRLAQTGRVAGAARYLAGRLDDNRDVRRWLDDFDRITCAPRRRDPAQGPGRASGFPAAMDAALADDPVDGRAGPDPRERRVAEALAAVWLHRNHRGTPEHDELPEAADALIGLLDHVDWSRTHAEPIHARAIDYRNTPRFLDEMV